jgi:hypothetical protein
LPARNAWPKLAANNFGISDETHNYKGTMTREPAAV